ncbi:hypothetical protein V6N13_061773 [Hibiscus sabdariffa]|uniref:S-protein homolog n=1 Tax=Hibiscus sabdariffa TaxID=183260 RepID=A0ABR2A9L5_9ROSI
MPFRLPSEANVNPSSMILLLSLTSLSAVSRAGFLPDKTHVLIYNDLAPGTDLVVHYKSKDDDLGVRHIAYGNDFKFHFRPSFWGTTLFYCSMQWSGTRHRFDIYKESRDLSLCSRCLWKIRTTGPCFVNYQTCYPWRPRLK